MNQSFGNFSKNVFRVIIFLALACVATASTGWAAVYYVDKNNTAASDANPGTESNPWKTIQNSANTAVAGDTVYVKNGTYYEWVSVKNSGTSGRPITFAAYPGHRPIIDGTGITLPSFYALFYVQGKNYITLDGFEVRNSKEVLIRMRDGGNFIIRNCIAHDNDGTNGADTNRSGIMITGSNIAMVEGNEVYHAGHNALDAQSASNVVFQYNYVHNNPNHNGVNIFPNTTENQIEYSGNHVRGNIITGTTNAIYMRYQTNNEISNNLIFGNSGVGIVMTKDTLQPHNWSANTQIFNNTIIGMNKNGIQSSNATYVTVKNNIITNCNYAVYIASGMTTGTIINNNLYYQNSQFAWNGTSYSSLSAWKLASKQDSASAEGNPNFSNISNSDYHLTTNSILAADKGIDLSASAIVRDLDGVTRPQGNGYDLGCYELKITTPAPLPPSNLRITN